MPVKKKTGASKRKMMAKIHIAKKDLVLDDETYRDVLFYTTGERSCSDMNLDQLSRVLAEFRRKGWKPQSKQGAKPRVSGSKQTTIDKIEAILADMQLPWSYATGMAKNMFEKEAVEFLDAVQLQKLMQALIVYQRRQTEKTDA